MDLTPEKLMAIYQIGGEEALIASVCVFDDIPEVNKIMRKMVDLIVLAFDGVITTDKFSEEMVILNEKMFESLGDAALDALNNGDIDNDQAEEYFSILNEKRDNCDRLEKKMSSKLKK